MDTQVMRALGEAGQRACWSLHQKKGQKVPCVTSEISYLDEIKRLFLWWGKGSPRQQPNCPGKGLTLEFCVFQTIPGLPLERQDGEVDGGVGFERKGCHTWDLGPEDIDVCLGCPLSNMRD